MADEPKPTRDELIETLRAIALDVNHALMVLPVPTDGQGKRAWQSLLHAKDTTEAALTRATT